MKLEKLFESKNSCLYSVDGKEMYLSDEMIVPVKWSDVEPGEAEQYNEEYLAELRLKLKAKEEKNEFAVIEPLFDKKAPDAQFTAAMKHTARRIKDCVSVIGFAIPTELVSAGGVNKESFGEGSSAGTYMAELLEKHAQYVFFCRKDDAGIRDICPVSIVLY